MTWRATRVLHILSRPQPGGFHSYILGWPLHVYHRDWSVGRNSVVVLIAVFWKLRCVGSQRMTPWMVTLHMRDPRKDPCWQRNSSSGGVSRSRKPYLFTSIYIGKYVPTVADIGEFKIVALSVEPLDQSTFLGHNLISSSSDLQQIIA